MIPVGTDAGFAVDIWASTTAVGDTSPRTQPRVITIAVTKAVSPIHLIIIAVSLVSPRHSALR